MEDEEFKKNITTEIEDLREDVNILAQYSKENLEVLNNLVQSLDKDFKTLEEDITKKIASSTRTTTNDVNYIKELISDDFKDMEKNLIDQVKKIIQG